MPGSEHVRPPTTARLLRTVTAHLATGRRMVVRLHIADNPRTPGHTEWITAELYGPNGQILTRRGTQCSGRNIPIGRRAFTHTVDDLTRLAERIEEDDIARPEDITRLLAAKGIEPARIDDRPATLHDTPDHDGYILTETAATQARPAALHLHVTGHAPFSEFAAILGALTDAGYTPSATSDAFTVTVRGATIAELDDREDAAARRVAPLAALLLP